MTGEGGELPGQQAVMEFEENRCTCDHAPADHAYAYGCTQPIDPTQDPATPCPCLASWEQVA